jgi:hypothetical protein
MTYLNNAAVNCAGTASECWDYGPPPSVDLGCFAYPDPKKFNHSKGWAVANNLVNLDPGFAHADPRGSLDFALRSDSLLLAAGFRPLPDASAYGPRRPTPLPPTFG